MTDSPIQPPASDPSRNPRILIVGSNGQLGRELAQIFTDVGFVIAIDRKSVDLADPDQTRDLIRRTAPDVILNAAAYTAVDRAESEMPLAHAVNALAPRVLAEEAAARNALLVHYSTDYVFDGSKQEPWTEDDAPAPLSVYGASKLAGEQAIQNSRARHLVFRTSWVYSPHGKNLLLTMLRLARERDRLSIVDDQIGAPTSSIELARATHAIVTGILAGRFGAAEGWSGLYHMTCAGSVSWFGFAQAIFARASAQLGIKPPELVPIASKDYPTPAARPRNSVLSSAKLHSRFGIQLSSWQSALEEVFGFLESGQASEK
ncbi:MAG TPA: dTDP-4-dehydrorhamnose reductase [Terracidiphilus sp.]|jgi:dTDP-4-dehydrorhamnose reductase